LVQWQGQWAKHERAAHGAQWGGSVRMSTRALPESTTPISARILTFAVVCALLYWGQVVLIPIALAALISFLLGPLVLRLHRWGVPRVPAVIVVVSLAGGLLLGLGWVVAGQLGELANELPSYRENIRAKVADLRALTRGGVLERVQNTVTALSEDIERDADVEAAAQGTAPAVEEPEPVPVQIAGDESLFGNATILNPVLEGLATAGLALLLSIFMLIKREDLRNRLVSLAGQASVVVTTKAIEEAGQRISRYLLMQFIINASMGLAVGLGLWVIGVPYSALWGLSAAVLRYIPYVGPWLAAVLPIAVSLVTSPGWSEVLVVISLFVVLELFSNNVMEPWLYGQSVGLSAIAVIVSVIFWTWLWGPVGLVLATPLTACLVVLSKYVPELAALNRLLGETPALPPHLRLYQRLLARDEDEAEDVVAEFRKEHSLAETCDGPVLGALLQLKRDLAAGRVSTDDGEFVTSALAELVDDLYDDAERQEPEEAAVADSALLIGFPARDRLDAIALGLLRALMREAHHELEVLSPDLLIGERIEQVAKRRPIAVCIPSLPPGDLTTTRRLCKRLRAQLPGVRVIVGRLGAHDAPERSGELLRAAGAERIVGSLTELRDLLLPIVQAVRPAANL
jgi:predicted PurR-regulated permease PerM